METKLIKNAGIARDLLNRGYSIVDIKPDRDNKIRTVFIFKIDDKKQFEADFDRAVDSLHKGSKKSDDIDIEKAKKLIELIKNL